MSIDFRRESRGDRSGYAAGSRSGAPADVDYRRDVGASRDIGGAARTQNDGRRRAHEAQDKPYGRQAESNRTEAAGHVAPGGAGAPAPAPRRVKRQSSNV